MPRSVTHCIGFYHFVVKGDFGQPYHTILVNMHTRVFDLFDGMLSAGMRDPRKCDWVINSELAYSVRNFKPSSHRVSAVIFDTDD